MARNKSDRLLELGFMLTQVGEQVEQARNKLETLQEQGYALTSPEIQGANATFNQYSNDFLRLEAKFNALKKEIDQR